MRRETLPGIGTYTLRNERDAEVWSRFAELCASQPAAFTRDPTIGGHITASAFILSPDLTSVLLTHHKKLNIWIQLGGHCDGVADAAYVARKEGYEESGLARLVQLSDEVFDLDIHQIPETPKEPAHLHYDVRFLFRADAGDIAISDESHDLRWVGLSELGSYTQEASVLRMVERSRPFTG